MRMMNYKSKGWKDKFSQIYLLGFFWYGGSTQEDS